MAQSDDGDPESGAFADVRHASPPRTNAPREVASGVTVEGRKYALVLSHAGRLTCLAVEYGDNADGSRPTGTVWVRGSEACVDPSERPVAASMEQLFVDPQTGEVSDTAQRFVYGVAPDEATDIVVRGPRGRSQRLQLTDVPGAIRVFAGSAPGQPAGIGSVVANHGGRAVGEQDLRFAGPKHMSDAEMRREHPPE